MGQTVTELSKSHDHIASMLSLIESAAAKHGDNTIVPIFVTVDPARDSPKAMKKYLKGARRARLV